MKNIDDIDIDEALESLSKPDSRKLRKALIEAGIEVPDYPNAAHHIVAGNSSNAIEAREILKRFGIDINTAPNGVFLPTVLDVSDAVYHPSLHSTSYYRKVTRLLSDANSKQDVLDILASIAEQLKKGKF